MQYRNQGALTGSSATIGIENNADAGLEYSFNTPVLTNGMAICFAFPGNRPDCADVDIPWLSELPKRGECRPEELPRWSSTSMLGLSHSLARMTPG